MQYQRIRQLLFRLEPETAHNLTLMLLRLMHRLKISQKLLEKIPDSPCEVMGLHFKNRIGLAAGLDKNGDAINALGDLGFGHIEVGCVTPRPQAGNPKPRLFRLLEDEALINRMGFNNCGVARMLKNLQTRQYTGVLGLNLGKNLETPLDRAAEDYEYSMTALYPYVDFMTVNISSPNTPGLRELQSTNYLLNLLASLKLKQQRLADQHKKYVPLAVKLSPDLDEEQIRDIAKTVASQNIDAVIATNTSLQRPPMLSNLKEEAGGLSGKPLGPISNEVIAKLYNDLPKSIPIIAVGGIMSAEDAVAKRQAGAQLVQLYTGLIYYGPQLITDIAKHPEFSI